METREKDILTLALTAGEIMLRNGGETYRVSETMQRICHNCGIPTVEAFVTPTGIFLSIDSGDSNQDVFTFHKSIQTRNIDLSKVSLVNDFSRTFTLEKYDLEEAKKILKTIDGPAQYPIWIRSIVAGFATASFTGMNGGSWNDISCSLVIGMIIYTLVSLHDQFQENIFIKTLFAAAVGTILAVICTGLGLTSNIGSVIIGAIMILLPGVAITNAIRDSISGDLLSGMVRAFEAFIISASIAVGVGLVLWTYYASILGGVIHG